MTATEIVQQLSFDYTALDYDTRLAVEMHTKALRGLFKRTAEDIWEIGDQLLQAKAALGHGQFLGWLSHEFGWSYRSASRFISVATTFKLDTVSNLNIAPTVLYQLASDDTPKEVRENLIERAASGEPITQTVAKAEIAAAKPKFQIGDWVRGIDFMRGGVAEGVIAQIGNKFLELESDISVAIGTATVIEPDSDEVPPIQTPDSREEEEAHYHSRPDAELPQKPESTPAPALATTKMDVHYSSESDEHYTPQHIITSVIAVLGEIILDPCSNSHHSPAVPSFYRYTKEDDGLGQTWDCKTLYMNPPYGDEISAWVDKLCTEHSNGNVREAIALVPARTDTKWFDTLTTAAACVCFVSGRLKFGDAKNSAPFPSAVVYLGGNTRKFREVFSKHGSVWVRLEAN